MEALSREVDRTAQRLILREIQGDKCAVCQYPFRDETPCIDHDHRTGMVRGLLCHNCNISEGFGSTWPPMVAYLNNPPAAQFKWEFQNFRFEWWRDSCEFCPSQSTRQSAAAVMGNALRPDSAAPLGFPPATGVKGVPVPR